MNVLKRCCFRSMKENRKRTAVTIIGIILATALITGVACLAVSFRVSMIRYEQQENGSYHYCFSGVRSENIKFFENNSNIEKIGLTEEVGYAVLKGSQNPDKPYLYIRAIDEEGIEAISLQLVEGRMPENDSEIVIGRHIRYNGRVDLKVGDTLPLTVSRRMSDGWELKQTNPYTYKEENLVSLYEKIYTVVGIVERPNSVVENRMAPGYSVFTCLDSPKASGTVDVYVNLTQWGLRHADKVIAGILGVPEEMCSRYLNLDYITDEEFASIKATVEGVTENYWLLKWLLFSFSDTTARWIYAMAAVAVLVIIVTSVFCIRNSFMISLTEKMKLYGRLASVGTTSKQQRKIIYYEAGFLGIVGIPLGILSGILATAILVRAVSGLLKAAIDVPLVFGISGMAVIAAFFLSAVTIFLSASKAARLAARVSPISAIRGNDMVKIGRRGLECPRIIDRVFGIGGKVAYKNLKRAKVKYRTTVISIVVSVAVFIGLTSFLQLMGVATGVYYTDRQYQIELILRGEKAYEGASVVKQLDGIEALEILRIDRAIVDSSQIPFTEEYKKTHTVEETEPMSLMALGESGYEAFCKEVGVSVEEARDKAIVLAGYNQNYFDEEQGQIVVQKGLIAQYKPGSVIEFLHGDEDADRAEKTQIEVLTQTKKEPMSMAGSYYGCVVLIVSDSWMEQKGFSGENNYVEVVIKCEDAGDMEESIRSALPSYEYSYTLNNYETAYNSDMAMHLIISIFLYGFITVVSLIGITNIFNTITTNMELRAPEFAMLRSVGMTGREFKRMIWLEGFFYGGKALIIGIPLGILLSLAFHRALGEGITTDFVMPWAGIGISIVAVAVLLYVIMRFSMGKLKHRNIIETIQNENI